MSKYKNIPTSNLLKMQKFCKANTDLTFIISDKKLIKKLNSRSNTIIKYKPNFNVGSISIQRNKTTNFDRYKAARHNICSYKDVASGVSLFLSHKDIRTIMKYGGLSLFLLGSKVKILTSWGRKLRSAFIKFISNNKDYQAMNVNNNQTNMTTEVKSN